MTIPWQFEMFYLRDSTRKFNFLLKRRFQFLNRNYWNVTFYSEILFLKNHLCRIFTTGICNSEFTCKILQNWLFVEFHVKDVLFFTNTLLVVSIISYSDYFDIKWCKPKKWGWVGENID